MKNNTKFCFLTAIFAIAMLSCEEDNDVAVTSVTISAPSGDAVLTVGGSTLTLTANVMPDNATDKTVTWTSATTTVATVNEQSGVVTAVAPGTSVITAASKNGKSGSVTVTVQAPKSSEKRMTGFRFTSPTALGEIDETAKTVAVRVPYGTNVTTLTPTIECSPMATVTPASGVAQNFTNPVTYTVKAEDETTAAYTVTVTAVTLVSIAITCEPTTKTYYIDDEFDTDGMEVTATFSDETTAPIPITPDMLEYDFSEPGVGRALIVTYGGQTATLTGITVIVPDITVAVTGEFIYNGQPIEPSGANVVVTGGSKTLTAGAHYTLAYSNNTNAGTAATVTAIGIGVYAGKTDTKNFTIKPLATTLAVTVETATYTYKKAAHEPPATVKWGENTLTATADYTLVYSNNVNAGTATVTLAGAGNFEGSAGTANFTISRFPISVVANDAEKNYWVSDPALTYTVTPALFGDDVLSGWLTRTGSNAVGIYEVTRGTLAQEGNYEITDFTPGVFTIYYFRGAGTSEEPYEIDVLQQLKGLGDFVNANNAAFNDKYYKLMADIDLNIAPYNSGTGWTPIGTSSNPFRGHFNGNYRKMTGLYCNRTTGLPNVGLFGYISGGSVRNLGIEGGSVTNGADYVGSIAGYITGSIIANCYSTVSVTSTNSRYYVGGLVGGAENNSIVSNCYATGAVIGSSHSVGGVAGYLNSGGIVTNCYATGAIRGADSGGGVVGAIQAGMQGSTCTVTYCAALNSSITQVGTNNNTSFGRVLGSSSGTATNSVGWINMTLTNNSIRSGENGANISAEDALKQSSYEAMLWRFGFNDDNPWKMGVGDYKLPVFYWQTTAPTAMPTHLQE